MHLAPSAGFSGESEHTVRGESPPVRGGTKREHGQKRPAVLALSPSLPADRCLGAREHVEQKYFRFLLLRHGQVEK